MEITRRETTWLHTHFVTDCVRLPAHRIREIERQVRPFLRQQGLVVGLHVEHRRGERTLRLVLECIPLPRVLERVETFLRDVVKPIPARPQPTRVQVLEPGAAPSPAARPAGPAGAR